MAGETRTRMLAAATEALRRGGVAGMSFTEVLEASGAARGAIYHHFPGGKAQLVAEAAGQHGAEVREQLATLSGDSPLAVVRAFLAAVRPVVAASAAGSGCAVAAVALSNGPAGGFTQGRAGGFTEGRAGGSTEGRAGGSTEPAARPGEVAATAFDSWTDELTTTLTSAGAPSAEAAELATALITVLEGAHVLCRAAGDLAPFERAAGAIVSLVRSRYPG